MSCKSDITGDKTPFKRGQGCEMGYWLGKAFWGQGIMSEAVKEMLRYAPDFLMTHSDKNPARF